MLNVYNTMPWTGVPDWTEQKKWRTFFVPAIVTLLPDRRTDVQPPRDPASHLSAMTARILAYLLFVCWHRNSGKKRFVLTYCSWSVLKGSQGRDLKSKPREDWPADVSSFLTQSKPIGPRMALPTEDWALLHQSTIKKYHTDMFTGQTDAGNYSTEIPLSQVCQVDKPRWGITDCSLKPPVLTIFSSSVSLCCSVTAVKKVRAAIVCERMQMWL